MKRKICAAVLAAVFALYSLTGCAISFGDLSPYKYADAQSYSEYASPVELSVSGEKLGYLSIEWINGEIEIVSGHLFTVSEENIKGEYYPLYWKFEDGALMIKYAKSGVPGKDLSDTGKKLVITVPCHVEDIDVDAVNVEYDISLRSAGRLRVDSVNGDGTVDLGQLTSCSFDSVNGGLDLTVRTSEGLENIDINKVNGDSVIRLDGTRAYSLGFSSVNGKATSDFDVSSMPEGQKINIKADTVNGGLEIKKYEGDVQGFVA